MAKAAPETCTINITRILTVTFEDAGPGRTKLTLKHEGHPAEMAKDATQGWNQSLDKFEAALR